jgi:hypothetical protein
VHVSALTKISKIFLGFYVLSIEIVKKGILSMDSKEWGRVLPLLYFELKFGGDLMCFTKKINKNMENIPKKVLDKLKFIIKVMTSWIIHYIPVKVTRSVRNLNLFGIKKICRIFTYVESTYVDS